MQQLLKNSAEMEGHHARFATMRGSSLWVMALYRSLINYNPVCGMFPFAGCSHLQLCTAGICGIFAGRWMLFVAANGTLHLGVSQHSSGKSQSTDSNWIAYPIFDVTKKIHQLNKVINTLIQSFFVRDWPMPGCQCSPLGEAHGIASRPSMVDRGRTGNHLAEMIEVKKIEDCVQYLMMLIYFDICWYILIYFDIFWWCDVSSGSLLQV